MKSLDINHGTTNIRVPGATITLHARDLNVLHDYLYDLESFDQLVFRVVMSTMWDLTRTPPGTATMIVPATISLMT